MLLIHICCDGSSWNRLVDSTQLSQSLANKIFKALNTKRKEIFIEQDEFDEIENNSTHHDWPAMVDNEVTVYVN